ncbi:MAG: hypothetical protein ACYDCL_04405 [Myxococcales bacterium]
MLSASCFAPQRDIPVPGCAKCRPAGSGSSGSAGSTGAGSSSGGATGGGSSGGSSGGTLADAGPDGGIPLTGEVCPDGSVTFPAQTSISGPATLYDFCASVELQGPVPLAGAQVATLPPWGATITAADGTYSICVQPNTPTTLVYSKPSYLTTYGPQLLLQPATITYGPQGDAYLVCQSEVTNYEQDAPLYDPSLATVITDYHSLSGQAPCGGHSTLSDGGMVANAAGWTFAPITTDGGDAGGLTAYFDDTYTLQLAPATFDIGIALTINLDPGLGFVSMTGSKPGVTDCQAPLLPGFTGLVQVASGVFSYYLYVVP